MKHIPIISLMLLMMTACGGDAEEKAISSKATEFADAYFNLDLHTALGMTTADSRRAIVMLASNLTQEDLDVVNRANIKATCSVEEVTLESDSTATVQLTVNDYLQLDTLGQCGHITEEGTFRLEMVKRGKQWMIRMASPLRSEKQSRG